MAKFRLIILIAGLLISGCASAPPVKYYVLAPEPMTPALATTSAPISIGIGPVTLPALLDRKKIVTRSPDGSIQIAEFHQWATPLQDSFADTLLHNLTALQPNHLFRMYPWSVHGTVDRQIIVDVFRFDSTPGESANLEANWTIRSEKNAKVLQSGKTLLRYAQPDASYAATVRSLSLLLNQFSQELAVELVKLEQK